MMKKFDTQSLKNWFLENKRDLPWRDTQNPYAVWVSEVMLQQTQVAVVIPYFLRWMERFPTIRSLAESPVDEVIKLWEGLGYYSRARNLHQGARYIVEHFDGKLPNNEKDLQQIKGLGPYTIGAILSFAFHQKKAAVDGNVLRVIARCFDLDDDIAKQTTNKKFRTLVESILPENESWIINEALIELGATVCQRKAQCTMCPLQGCCLALKKGRADELPIKSKGPKTTHLCRSVAVIEYKRKFLVRRGKKGEIMADLYEFPFFEKTDLLETMELVQAHYGLKPVSSARLPQVTHSFTRYQVKLEPTLIVVRQMIHLTDFEWLTLDEMKALPFSSGHRRIFQCLLLNS